MGKNTPPLGSDTPKVDRAAKTPSPSAVVENLPPDIWPWEPVLSPGYQPPPGLVRAPWTPGYQPPDTQPRSRPSTPGYPALYPPAGTPYPPDILGLYQIN